MKLAFMTSVCPAATLAEAIDLAKRFGYQALEFRPDWKQAHGVEVEASADSRRELKKRLADSGIAACCISPGSKFTEADKSARDAQYDRLLRVIELAANFDIPCIRVFADPMPKLGHGQRAAAYRTHADYLGRAAEKAHAADSTLVLETHGNCRAFDVGEIMYQAGYPAGLRVNWHLLHCLVHGEDVDEAYRHVKGRVAHVHFAVDEKTPVSDLSRQWELLADDRYDGYCSVEVINPPDPIPVLEQHAKAWSELTR